MTNFEIFDDRFKNLLLPHSKLLTLATGFGFIEGPAYFEAGYLIFSDIPANRIYRLDAEEQLEVFLEPSRTTNGLMFNESGDLVACEMEGRLVVIDAAGDDLFTGRFGSEEPLLLVESPNAGARGQGSTWMTLARHAQVLRGHSPDGQILWESPYNADNGSIIMAPVQVGEYLYVGGYQEKNLLLKLGSGKPEVVWRNKLKHGVSAVNVQPFVADGLIYGFHEKGDLRAVAIPSGEVVWKGGGPLGERPA